jgi:hypothetical protein
MHLDCYDYDPSADTENDPESDEMGSMSKTSHILLDGIVNDRFQDLTVPD